MFKKLFPLLILLTLLVCSGCSTTGQVTVGQALLTMHDLIKTSAVAADSLCKQGTIKPADCATISTAYQKIQAAWPVVDDALIVYLKADPTDATAAANFQAAQSQFTVLYADMVNLLTKTGAIKGGN